jgi:GNAT superfamily N-acetyltransferase
MTNRDELRVDRATMDEAALLAELNLQLFEDEAHPYPMSRAALTERMRRWIAGEYEVLLFRRGTRVAGYAAWRVEDRGAYLRHFFICRDQRRKSLGRAAVALLCRDVFPRDLPVQIEASVWNKQAIDFWHALGFEDFGIVMELKAGQTPK